MNKFQITTMGAVAIVGLFVLGVAAKNLLLDSDDFETNTPGEGTVSKRSGDVSQKPGENDKSAFDTAEPSEGQSDDSTPSDEGTDRGNQSANQTGTGRKPTGDNTAPDGGTSRSTNAKSDVDQFLAAPDGSKKAEEAKEAIKENLSDNPGRAISSLESKLKDSSTSRTNTSRLLRLLHEEGGIHGQLLMGDLLNSERTVLVRAVLDTISQVREPASDLVDALMHQIRIRKTSDPLFSRFVQTARNLSRDADPEHRPGIRNRLLSALGKRIKTPSLDELKKQLKNNPSETRKAMLVSALADASGPEVVRYLLDEFRNASTPLAVGAYAHALAERDLDEYRSDDRQESTSDGKRVEHEAWAFFKEKLSYSGRIFVRYTAVEFFGKRHRNGNTEATSLLQEAARKDENVAVKKRAKFYLGD